MLQKQRYYNMYRFVLLFIGIIAAPISAQSTLEYNLAVGQEYYISQEAKQHITQDIQGVDQIIENHLISEMLFKVIKVEAQTYTLEMRFKRMKMLMSSPTMGVMLDADTFIDNEGDLTALLFRGSLNVPVTVVMTKSGNIKSVTGGDKIIESMFKNANITDQTVIDSSKKQFETQFSSTALSQSFEQMTYFLPSKKVAIGNQWQTEYSGSLQAKNVWTLKSLDKNSYAITGKSNSIMSTIDDQVNMVLDGIQEISIKGNPKTGWFSSISITGSHSGNTEVKQAGLHIPTQITSTVTYQIIN